jgi:L-ribulokinase
MSDTTQEREASPEPNGARYAIGVDYGTASVRAVVVDVAGGAEVGTGTYQYRRGTGGVIVSPADPHLARQDPQDYVDGFHASVADAVREARDNVGLRAEDVVGIGIDTTGSSPLPADASGMPLAFDPRFRDDLAAQTWLWKDHTSHAEADQITELARSWPTPYVARYGGVYSSEWFWAKILRCRNVAPDVFAAAATWCEASDFIPAYVTGTGERMARNACAAGHKAMFSEDWGGLPDDAFLGTLHPDLAELRARLYESVVASDRSIGGLTEAVATAVGLRPGISVAAGLMDAHAGAVASGVRPGRLVKVMGTSTCDCSVYDADGAIPTIPGLCGVARDSIVPGMLGIEAGQSAVGDLFGWFADNFCPPELAGDGAHAGLTAAAERLRPGESGLLALDWNNGNRTVLVDHRLTGLLLGQTLHTRAPEVYRSLVEATAFGARTIVDRLEAFGVPVKDIVVCGGISRKSSFVLGIYADVLNRPIRVAGAAEVCAVGAAMFGAVAAGVHPSIEAAQEGMTRGADATFTPDPARAAVYDRLYSLYVRLHDAFGGVSSNGDMGSVMKDLIAIREEATA